MPLTLPQPQSPSELAPGPVAAHAPSRDLGLDLARTVAVFFVVLVHVSAETFYQFSPNWLATISLNSASRTAVPIFLMISGAVLLRREHSATSALRRVVRICIPLLFWSVIYLAFDGGLWNSEGFQWQSLKRILDGSVKYHLWFIYAMIPVYAFMPIYGAYAIAPRQSMLYCLSAWFIAFSILPFIKALTGFEVGIDNRAGMAIGYLLLGIYLHRDRCPPERATKSRSTAGFALWAILALLTFALTWWRSHATGKPVETFLRRDTPHTVLAAAGLFVFLSSFRLKLTGTFWKTLLKYTARTSFGVYLVHVLVLEALRRNGISTTMGSPWLGIPLFTVMVYVGSFIIVEFMRRIPALKRMVS